MGWTLECTNEQRRFLWIGYAADGFTGCVLLCSGLDVGDCRFGGQYGWQHIEGCLDGSVDSGDSVARLNSPGPLIQFLDEVVVCIFLCVFRISYISSSNCKAKLEC